MTPDDRKVWKQVTEGITPLDLTSTAAIIRPYARRPTTYAGVFCSTLDLHGYTLVQAHAECRSFIQEAHKRGVKSITIITGLSGAIRKEFVHWADLMSQVRKIEPINGGGAFKLFLVRKTKTK